MGRWLVVGVGECNGYWVSVVVVVGEREMLELTL